MLSVGAFIPCFHVPVLSWVCSVSDLLKQCWCCTMWECNCCRWVKLADFNTQFLLLFTLCREWVAGSGFDILWWKSWHAGVDGDDLQQEGTVSGESNMLKMSLITSSSLTGSCLWVHVLGCNQTQQLQDVSTRTQTIFFPLFLGMFLRTFVSKWIHCKRLLLRRRVEDVGDEKETLHRFVQIQSEHQKSASLYGILSLFTSVINLSPSASWTPKLL